MDWFLYDNGLRPQRVNHVKSRSSLFFNKLVVTAPRELGILLKFSVVYLIVFYTLQTIR